MTLAVTVLLGLASFVMRGSGALVSRMPAAVASRIGGIAPALLAALVVTALTNHNGTLAVDARLAGIALATVLAVLRMPFVVCMVAASAATALLRALGIG